MVDKKTISYRQFLSIDKYLREHIEELDNGTPLGWMSELFIKDLLGIVFPSQKIILERPSSSQLREQMRLSVMNQDMV